MFPTIVENKCWIAGPDPIIPSSHFPIISPMLYFQKWLDRVVYDVETAKAMLQTGRLVYAIFMCQQAL
jgi:hypothetical protein